MEAAEAANVQFDPSLIPPEAAEHLAAETLRLVLWMRTIPRYREAMEEIKAALRLRDSGGAI